jgi:two-component system, cell cycle sensor histidine kinase and response regulator CckA
MANDTDTQRSAGVPSSLVTAEGEPVRDQEHAHPIRVVIADDSEAMRRRLRTHLASDPRLEIVGEASDAPSTIAMVDRVRPDAVVLDLRMPGGGGIHVLEALKERDPAPAVIVVSNYVFDEYRERCLELGAREVLDKSNAFDRVAETLTAQRPLPAPSEEPKPSDPYASAMEVLDDPVALLDAQGLIQRVNAAWLGTREPRDHRDRGRHFGEVLRERSGDCAPGLATAEMGIQDVLAGRSDAFTLSYPCQLVDGSAWFRVRVRRLGNNGTSAVLLEHRNVTEIETMAQALRDNERRFRLLTENARDIVYRYRLRPTRGYEYVSPAVTVVTGYTPEEHYADPDLGSRIVHPEDRARFQTARDTAGDAGLLELRWIRKDGRVIWTEQQTVPVRDAAGELVAVEGIVRDVTDRMDAQQAVRESEERLRMLFTHAPDVYILMSPDGTIVDANQAAERVLGYRVADVIGRPVGELHALDVEGLDEARGLLTQLAGGIVTGVAREFWVRRPDDAKVLLEVRGHPVRIAGQPLILVIGRDVTQRHTSEQAMRLQAAALESAANAVVISDRDGRIEWVNRAFTRLTGYLREEVIGQNPRLLKSGEQDPAFYSELWDTVLAGRVWHGQLVNRRQDRSLYTEEMTITPVLNALGEVTHFVAIKEDVSDRLAAERSLRESEARFRAVAESASDALLIADEEGRIVYWNRAAAKGFGYDEIARQDLWLNDLIPSEARGVDERRVSRAVASGTLPIDGGPTVVTGRRRDGSTFPVEMTLGSWKRGGRSYYCAILRDISDRKAAEAALRASEERFRATFDHAAVGIIHGMTDGRFLRVNRKFADMLGYAPEELVGIRFQDLTDPESLSEQMPMFNELVAGHRDTFRIEKRYLAKGGGVVWASISVSAVRRPDGAVDHLIGVVEDITQRRQLEQQLYQAQKMEAVGRLAGGVAHDFNNLLTIMRGESELALFDLTEDHPARESLTAIRQASDRAAVLTSRLLTFSRKQMVELTVFGLNDLVMDAERMLRRLLEANIKFSAALGDGILPVRADRGQMEQVLLNLVVNARDAMAEGGELTIRSGVMEIDGETAARHEATPGAFAVLTVSDTGVGMSEETQAHIFEPFFTTKPRGQGTGLGLATCFGIVKQAGGFLDVTSTAGVGTTMAVYLPLANDAVQADAPAVPVVVLGGTETILVAEDEDAVRRIACRILTGEGYRVLEAGDGEEALAVLATYEGPVDLLLTDVMMPRLGGRDLATQVAASERSIRVLYMSGYTDDEVLRRSFEGEEAILIRKPFTRETLLRRVREALDQAIGG